NYTVTFTNGKYTITPKAITVSADDLTKVYGQEDATLTYTTDGLVGEDTLSGSLKRAAGENKGEYAITQDTTLANSNYTVTFTNGKYTITPKAITVSADDLSKILGEEDSVLTYTTNGLVGNDKLIGSLLRASGEEVGDYIISGDLTNSNYTITFNDGIYTIKTNNALNNVITPIVNQTVLKAQQQISSATPSNQEQRVRLGSNDAIQIVNGGVKLPVGVEQIFFVSNNENNEEN
ncbi:MBG domain-containing protein, partial [Poseidonibacter antarcticus]|uniref:MBG domain-containing protein n=1 Tax=Poseidonibacter antarcticus TaxID=2478538 RepID=UPI0022491347